MESTCVRRVGPTPLCLAATTRSRGSERWKLREKTEWAAPLRSSHELFNCCAIRAYETVQPRGGVGIVLFHPNVESAPRLRIAPTLHSFCVATGQLWGCQGVQALIHGLLPAPRSRLVVGPSAAGPPRHGKPLQAFHEDKQGLWQAIIAFTLREAIRGAQDRRQLAQILVRIRGKQAIEISGAIPRFHWR